MTDDMIYNIGLTVALTLFGLGFFHKILGWFRHGPGGHSFGRRLAHGLRGLGRLVFSRRLPVFGWVLVRDGLFQIRLLRRDFPGWLMHVLLFWGFFGLLLMHALDNLLTAKLFSGYQSTVNPFLALRNLFGVMVLVGVGLAVWRRVRRPALRRMTGQTDVIALVLLGTILFSGFMLEATKINSPGRFQAMVNEYLDPGAVEEIVKLKAYWATHYGVRFAGLEGPFPPPTLARGQKIHQASCAECHSRPTWAFASWGLSRVLAPLTPGLERVRAITILWYLHFLACFIGLAYLPFSKFWHLLATPLSQALNQTLDRETMPPARAMTLQALELDACTRCAACAEACSVVQSWKCLGNETILPAHKLAAYQKVFRGKRLTEPDLLVLQEGQSICTNCHRCTDVCPAGIDLHEMWRTLEVDLHQRGYPGSFTWARVLAEKGKAGDRLAAVEPRWSEFQTGLDLAAQTGDFWACFECVTCTNGCPVVANYEDPGEVLGLLPHQVMRALRLGLKEEVLGARMVWDCLACYQCQEECPQGIQVADILYELRAMGFQSLRDYAGNKS
ncbi:MAG: 4Fe-4S dicluster domain-containing protein [Proteobacteria bacterium]|nr:4Fe-4S dicluster domain-containing protein [Pseudomonadota bacterium]MBU1742209.1 4Fe-4S dicluster domain-containing protein [Pseudomonadota bacterium]